MFLIIVRYIKHFLLESTTLKVTWRWHCVAFQCCIGINAIIWHFTILFEVNAV